MDPNSQRLIQGAAGAGKKVYVEDVFSTWLYTGNGSTQTITNGIDLADEGGLVWLKGRSSAISNYLYDTVNGGTSYLSTNTTGALANTGSTVVDFDSTGFTFPSGNVSGENVNNATYASWTFRKAPKFFDVVTYTGNGTLLTLNHNLGSTPGCIIVKRTDSTGNWPVYHRSLSTDATVYLNTTSAAVTRVEEFGNVTSTTFQVGDSGGGSSQTNASGGTYVAYLFAHDAGGFGDDGTESVIKCGSFATDGSGNIGTVSLGWEPQWILTKRTDNTQAWYLWDSMRGMSLTSGSTLSPNNSDAEVVMGGTSYLYPTATGFAGSGNFYGPNATVAYIAIRRGPMKTPEDATKVFNTATGTYTSLATLTAADMVLFKGRSNNGQTEGQITDRLRGFKPFSNWTVGTTSTSPFLVPSSTAAEVTTGGSYTGTEPNGLNVFGNKNAPVSVVYGNPTNVSASGVNYSFRRAPGFFDVVAYTGDGTSGRQIPHNLGSVPECIIYKRRDSTGDWFVYHTALGTDHTFLNSGIGSNGTNYMVAPTSTVFEIGSLFSSLNNSGATFIAYLFATCPGVSKVGSYTGTGTTLDIDCGFTSGARFVMIKCTNVSGDWFVWDTTRGIVSGNDPYLLLNTTDVENNSFDMIEPLSSGFRLNPGFAGSSGSGDNYIFLAIA